MGEPTCPKCGMPVSATPGTKASDELDRRIAEERRLERERTSTLPRIESAIPSEPDPRVEGVYGRERLPHTKVFALAAIASLLVVGGAALVITHPGTRRSPTRAPRRPRTRLRRASRGRSTGLRARTRETLTPQRSSPPTRPRSPRSRRPTRRSQTSRHERTSSRAAWTRRASPQRRGARGRRAGRQAACARREQRGLHHRRH